MIYLRKDAFPHVLPATKNGRFTYEPSVLCGTLAKATGAAKESFPALDFLLLPFLSRKKRKGGTISFLEEKKQKTLRDS